MSDILKIHFYLFFREHEIGIHMKLTWNCWFDSDDKKISMSKEAVEWIYLWYMVQSSFAIFMQLISIVDTVKV